MWRPVCGFVLLLGLPAITPGAWAAAQAPSFALPRLDGGGTLVSTSIFATQPRTFLVFWWSHCPRCVELLRSCESFYRAHAGDSVAVVGIDGDESDRFVVRAVVAASGVSFPQLRDPGGTVAARYAILAGTFSVCLVARDGEMLATRIDPQGDLAAAMEGMLAEPGGTAAAAPAALPGTAMASDGGALAGRGLALHVDQRLRFLSIDPHGTQATGAYGEELTPGNRLDLRLEVEAAQRLSADWRVGGLLRISTEGEQVLDAGPKYFGSEWGSAFTEYESPALGVRAGYYPVFMTPLTLMRWDWDDSPRTGSNAGCGCSAGAGTLLAEGLDDLAPELTFEGVLGWASAAGFEVRSLYALPRRARRTSNSSYRLAGEPRARYALEFYGFEARWQRFDRRTGGMWRAAVHAAGTSEDSRSVDFVSLGYPAGDPWTENWIVTATGEFPLVHFVHLRGEVVGWNRTKTHVPAVPDGSMDTELRGNGGVMGIVAQKSADLNVKFDYLRLDPGYHATFAALSYAADNEGVRASAQLPLPGDRGVVSLFYKRLRADQPPATAERQQSALAGVAADLDLVEGLGAGAGWIDDDVWRNGIVQPVDRRRHALTASVHYDFRKTGTVLLEYQRTHQRERVADRPLVSTADLYTVQVTASF
jgi:hypothetical protein